MIIACVLVHYQEKGAYRTRPDPKVLLLYKLDIFIHTFVS